MQFILWLTFQVLTLNTIHSFNNNGCKLNLPPAPPPKIPWNSARTDNLECKFIPLITWENKLQNFS